MAVNALYCIGTLLITATTILHFVCMSTSHLATIDLGAFPKAWEEFVFQKQEQGWGGEQVDSLNAWAGECLRSGSNVSQLYYGLRKVCAVQHAQLECSTWKSGQLPFDLNLIQLSPPSDWLEGVFLSSAIVAVGLCLLCWSGLFVLNQRFKPFPLITGIASAFTGLLILSGDVIFALSYRNLSLPCCNQERDQMCSVVVTLLERQMTLTWGLYLDGSSAAIIVLLAAPLHWWSRKALK